MYARGLATTNTLHTLNCGQQGNTYPSLLIFFDFFFDMLARFFKKIPQYALWHLGKEFVELE